MPRTISAGERTLLGGAAFNTHKRLNVRNASGQYIEVTNLGGVSWLQRAQWSEDIDQPVMSGTFTLRREAGGNSLAPLLAASQYNRDANGLYAPLLYPGRQIKLETAVTAAGVAPVSGDWREVFLGKIDDVDWGSSDSLIPLAVRDMGAFLADTFIEDPTVYSNPGGQPVQTVMQQILDDWMGPGAITLYTPSNPNWIILEYEQAQVSVLEAIRALALQIGYDVRYRYDSNHVFRLTFFNPRAIKTTPDVTFGPTEYLDVRNLTIGDSQVRNVVRILWAA